MEDFVDLDIFQMNELGLPTKLCTNLFLIRRVFYFYASVLNIVSQNISL